MFNIFKFMRLFTFIFLKKIQILVLSLLQITGDRDMSSYLKRVCHCMKIKIIKTNIKLKLIHLCQKEILVKDKSTNTTDYKLIALQKMILFKYE